MNTRILDRLLITASIGLLTAGGIFLSIGIFGDGDTAKPLSYAVGCALLGNLFNLIRQLNGKTKQDTER